MQPESSHHAQDSFAQGLGPYTEIPVETRVSLRYSYSASPCADPGSKFIRIYLAALLERDLLILRAS